MTDAAWNEGGRERSLDRVGISVTHDELLQALGESRRLIDDAGFVLVTRRWRDDALKTLDRFADMRKVATELMAAIDRTIFHDLGRQDPPKAPETDLSDDDVPDGSGYMRDDGPMTCGHIRRMREALW